MNGRIKMADQDMPGFRGMRYSKFRHVYGNPYRREKCYNNIPITKNSHDANFCAVNPKFLAIILESQGGGAFVVIPIERYGRVDALNSKVAGHKGPVLDIKWNPFNDNQIASSSEDAAVKVWGIPDSGIVGESSATLLADLILHTRRVVQIEWHPTAEGILASAGQDNKIIIWDVEQQEAINIIQCHPERIFCLAFNFMGDLLATTCRDKKIRIIDVRSGEVLKITNGHNGNKSSKIIFAGDSDCLITSGTNRMSNRQIAVWKQDDFTEPLDIVDIDTGTGTQLLFYDPDSKVAFTAGKGDGSIRYFEINPDENPHIFSLNQYITSMPQCGLGMMPKRAMDMKQCELVRFYKLHVSKGVCEPVSMIVPRKSEAFQEDIYPQTMSNEPALTAQDWIAGRDSPPKMVLLGENRRATIESTPHRPSLRESMAQSKTKSTKKTQEADNRFIERSKSEKEAVSQSQYSPSRSGSSYSSTRRVEMSSSVKGRQTSVEKENIIPVVSSSSVHSAPPSAPEEDVSTLSEVSSITSSQSESSSKSTHQSDGNKSIASRMAMFEDGSRRSWRRAASLDSASPSSPTKFRLTDTINEDESDVFKDRGDRSSLHTGASRTHSNEDNEVLRINLDSKQEASGQSGNEMIRSNGDGKEMSKTLRSSSDAGVRREFMTSKDLGMEQLRKAFLRQQEEIKQYKSQLMLKDQRIRQLEREIEDLTMTSEA